MGAQRGNRTVGPATRGVGGMRAHSDAARWIRLIRIQQATIQVAWTLAILMHLREHGAANTADLAWAAGVEGHTDAHRFKSLVYRLRRDGTIARAGDASGPMGWAGYLWALPGAEMRR